MDNNRTANEDVSDIIHRYIRGTTKLNTKKGKVADVQPSFFVWAR